MKRTTSMIAVLSALLLVAAACGNGNGNDADGPENGDQITVIGDVNADPNDPGFLGIYVPDDLALPVERMAEFFREVDPEAVIRITKGPSDQLRERIDDDDASGVYIDAPEEIAELDTDLETGDVLDLGEDPVRMIVADDNPRAVPGLEAFGSADWTTGLCVSDVPCGDLGRQLLADADVDPDPDRTGDDGVVLVNAVADGDLDAALAMRSQTRMRFRAVEPILLLEGSNEELAPLVIALEYELVPVGSGGALDAFLAYLGSPEGDRDLQIAGLRSFDV